jgi:hypothetical protein
MTKRVYPKAKAAAFSGGANVNLLTVTVKMILIDTGAYTYSEAHEFLSDVPSGARLSTSAALTGKSLAADASFHSANTRFEGVTSTSAEGLLWFVDTGSDASSRLIAFQDEDVTGLPVTPAGESYNVVKDSGGWFFF